MRTVTINISKLGLVVGDVVKVQLLNSIGGLLLSNSGYMHDSTTTLASSVFEISLLENEHIDTLSNYKITLPNSLSFSFKVPVSFENTPHDMLALMRLGSVKDVIDTYTKTLDTKFQEKLELYFTGENPYFTKTQRDVVDFYAYYADTVKDTSSTIDIMKMMDEYLATIKGVL